MFPHATHRRFDRALHQSLPGTEALEQRRLLSMVDLDPHFDVGQPLGTDGGRVRLLAQLEGSKVLAAGSYVDSAKVLRFTATGALDDTFGVGGVATVPVRFYPNAATLQADGKIVLSGVDYNHSEAPFYVARLTADGLMDATFGSGGIVNLPSLAHMNPWVGAADVADDGKIIIMANGSDYVNLIRLTTAGALDTTFDGDGINEVPDAYGTDIAVQNDGKIVIVGGGFRAARVTAAGALDSRFGTNGFVRGTGTFDGRCVVVQDDGAIVVGASRSLQLGPIIRLTASGAFDRGFQDSSPDSKEDFVSDLLIDPANGKLLAVKAQGSSDVAFIERFNADGTLDYSLNDGEPLAATAGCLALTTDGGFLIGPERVYYDGGDNFEVKRYRVRPNVELDTDGTLFITGTAGADTMAVRINPAASGEVLVNRNGSISKYVASAVQRVNVMTGNGNDTFSCSLAAPTIIYGGTGDDSIATSAGNDTIYDAAGNDTVNTGDGSDFLESGAGNDQFNTGAGDDTVLLLLGADSINAGDGNDSITSQEAQAADFGAPIVIDLGAGNDLLTGSSLQTPFVVSGGDGNDTIATPYRDDTIDAGAGDDYVASTGGDDQVYGGPGNDLLGGYSGNDLLVGGEGDDTLRAGSYPTGGFPTDRNTLVGGAGNDRIEGGDGPDLLVGNGGNDRIRGFGGADRIYGRAGVDRLDGGAGGDRIYGDDGDDFLLEGGPGNDRIYGGLGDDSICGGSGNDELYCGGGADTLIGNKGNDVLNAADSASDLLDGGRGLDSATFDDDTLDRMTSIEQLL